jgi:hypothetical protein
MVALLTGSSFLADTINEFYFITGHRGSMVNNIYYLIEFSLINLCFIAIMPSLRKIASFISLAFLIVFLLTTLYWQDIHTYQSITRLSGTAIFLYYTAFFYRDLMKDLPADNIWLHPPFWIVFAFFLYYSLNLVVFSLSHFFFTELPPRYGALLWIYHSLAEIFKNGLLFWGLFVSAKDVTHSYKTV